MNKSIMPIYTERFMLREFHLNDAANLFYLNNDPEVIKYTGDVSFENVEAAEQLLKNYTQYRQYGYGRWAVIEKSTDDFLGWCGLKFITDINETDIGYRFFQKHWGKGIATEVAKACIDVGFNYFGLTKIVGRSMKANAASINVLKKIGLNYWKECDFDGHEGVYYKISKP